MSAISLLLATENGPTQTQVDGCIVWNGHNTVFGSTHIDFCTNSFLAIFNIFTYTNTNNMINFSSVQ